MTRRAKPTPSRDVAQFYLPDPEQPFPTAVGTRWNPAISGASGYRDVVTVSEGFQVVVGDVLHDQSATITVDEKGIAKFHFRLSGTGRAALQGGEKVDIPERCWAMMLHPDTLTKKEWYFAGQHEQSVTLLLRRHFLRERVGDVLDALPVEVKDYVAGNASEPHQRVLPLRADMAQAATALLACELSGTLRLIYAKAKGFELLTLALQSLVDTESGENRNWLGLSTADQEGVQRAREYLEAHFLAPPTIASLAEQIGMSEAKLMRGFKQTFGVTLFEYAQSLRMERAKKLLETTDLTVTTIALDVGYEYASNFTTAFKRHFGVTPRAARDAVNP